MLFSEFKKEFPLQFKIVKVDNKEIKVKQYLPVNEKLALITRVLQAVAGNDYNFINPVQLDVYTNIEIVKTYSDIEFSAEDEASPADLYDVLVNSGILDAVIDALPTLEYNYIKTGVEDTVAAYYTYQNSVLGILENVSKDYKDLDLEADDIKKKIADPENLGLLKDVITKLG